jgi:hypothetical protein
MNLRPVFYDRGTLLTNTFTPKLIKPILNWTVNRINKNAIGGPMFCDLSASGSVDNLFELVEWLKCPVEIYDDANRACWWGFVNEVQINTGYISFGVSLDTMYNKVIVYYGDGHNTATVNDPVSLATYGKKLGRLTMALDDFNQANAFRDAMLARRKYPVPSISIEPGTPGAQVYCKGWWSILDWGTWVDSDAGDVDTAVQVQNILVGTWPTSYVDTPSHGSGISTSRTHRGGEQSARETAEELLRSGTSNGLRMLAYVDILKQVHIIEEPASTSDDLWLTNKGKVQNGLGVEIPKYLVDAGQWLRLKDVVPATADVSMLANPAKIFLEEVEYSGDNLRITARDIPNDLDIFHLGAG